MLSNNLLMSLVADLYDNIDRGDMDKSAEAAMNQINLKDYASRFALLGLPIVKVGINFDSEKRTIGDWKIEAVPLKA